MCGAICSRVRLLAGIQFQAQRKLRESAKRDHEGGGPNATLKAVLSAACSQNQSEFGRFLTARSMEAFSRMTPQARIALMKRFVLLNEPGKPTASANPAGRPIVRCQTPDVTTEMQIGGADLRDNVRFSPWISVMPPIPQVLMPTRSL